MAKLALMADKWLAKVGVDEPFVVKNCKYAINNHRGEFKQRSLHEDCEGYK